jgi:hypothetical protein
METEETEILHAVGMRLGFRGAANALKGGSTPPPAAKSPNWEILNKNVQEIGIGPGQDCG